MGESRAASTVVVRVTDDLYTLEFWHVILH
jgi:hypothetical protein